ncbi:CPBP family intramembrane glutamic endopeptidase [Arthrobacter sp.]|uniref:CPBP family intramembrane glutamic endopeptidase n=1 Tax=Arthrobacter sp. TaxID=1667 RepID=UPI003A939788
MTRSADIHRPEAPGDTELPGLAYHRLTRAWPAYRWWKPLVVGALGAGFYAAFFLIGMVILLIAGMIIPDLGRAADGFFEGPDILDLNDPFTLVVTLSSIILMWPALWLATLVLGAKPVGLLSSVAGRIRWTWLLRCLGVAFVVTVAAQGISLALPGAGADDPAARFDGTSTLVVLAAALVLVPIQATAEEYVFRGYLMQTLGGWLRHPAFAILLPVPLFVLSHDYALWGMIDVAVFAVAAGWLTWRTGGLEAAIALHIANNTGIFVLVAFGAVDANADDVGFVDLLISMAILTASIAVMTRLARHRKIQRTSWSTVGLAPSR